MKDRQVRRSRLFPFSICALTAALIPSRAEAHLVTTGLGPVYDGVSHVLVSPEDLVPIIAAALLAGLNGTATARRALFVLPAAWLTGGMAGYLIAPPSLPAFVTSASFLVLGILTASDRRVGQHGLTALAGAVGLLHGVLNGAGIAEAQREPLGLAGIAAAIFVLVALTAAPVVRLRSGAGRVVIRVIGSWITAIGLLMLGWGLRGL